MAEMDAGQSGIWERITKVWKAMLQGLIILLRQERSPRAELQDAGSSAEGGGREPAGGWEVGRASTERPGDGQGPAPALWPAEGAALPEDSGAGRQGGECHWTRSWGLGTPCWRGDLGDPRDTASHRLTGSACALRHRKGRAQRTRTGVSPCSPCTRGSAGKEGWFGGSTTERPRGQSFFNFLHSANLPTGPTAYMLDPGKLWPHWGAATHEQPGLCGPPSLWGSPAQPASSVQGRGWRLGPGSGGGHGPEALASGGLSWKGEFASLRAGGRKG